MVEKKTISESMKGAVNNSQTTIGLKIQLILKQSSLETLVYFPGTDFRCKYIFILIDVIKLKKLTSKNVFSSHHLENC